LSESFVLTYFTKTRFTEIIHNSTILDLGTKIQESSVQKGISVLIK